MSSVDWKKLKGPEIDAMIHHAARHDGKDVTYRNKYIDKSRTHLNYTIGPEIGRRFDDLSGSGEAQRLKKRVEEIDAVEPPKRRRKDRVTAVAFCVTVPDGLDPGQEKTFFKIAYKHIAKQCGGFINVSTAFIHVDECHSYVDAVTGEKRVSKPHAHIIGIPYVKGIGVNGAKFETRETLRALNRRIDDECRKELGVPFMTGKYQALCGRSVEDLQAESVNMAKRKAIEEAEEKARKAEELKMKAVEETEAIRKQQAGLTAKYNTLVGAFNGLLERAKELGIDIDAYVRDLSQTQHISK